MKEYKSTALTLVQRESSPFFEAKKGGKTVGNGFFSESIKAQSIPASVSSCKPNLKSLTATPGSKAVMTNAWSGRCELSLGTPSNPGMIFSSIVDVPDNCNGRLEYLQLAKSCRQRTDIDNSDTKAANDDFGLDSKAGLNQVVGNAGTVTFSHTDSPGAVTDLGTKQSKYLKISDSYKMWLLWTPANAPTVALGMVTWSWQAKASRNFIGTSCESAWTVNEQEIVGGTGLETDTLPVWTSESSFSESDYSPGPC